jgi:RHS repeat-associated protein
LEAYEYRRYQAGAAPAWTPLRFPGQYFDAETDLFENWNRYYDPSVGRYLQPEPILLSPASTREEARNGRAPLPYSYALNNPLSGVDEDGRFVLVRSDDPASEERLLRVARRLDASRCIHEWLRKCFVTDPFLTGQPWVFQYWTGRSVFGCVKGADAVTSMFRHETNLCPGGMTGGGKNADRELAAIMMHELAHQISPVFTNDMLDYIGLFRGGGQCTAKEAEALAYDVWDKGDNACSCK